MAAPGPDSRKAKTRRPVTAISSASPVAGHLLALAPLTVQVGGTQP